MLLHSGNPKAQEIGHEVELTVGVGTKEATRKIEVDG